MEPGAFTKSVKCILNLSRPDKTNPVCGVRSILAMELKMRAEVQSKVDEIREALSLIRRHL